MSGHANRTGSRFGLTGMVVARLRRHCPQHQGQAKPRRPAENQTHMFLHRDKMQ